MPWFSLPLLAGLRRRGGWLLGAVAVAAGLLWPWWRNHTILRDLYDYGLVISAAGRMAAGERPYVDFLTPIQTLHFLQAMGAEAIWGARYLSLTYANAVFIAGSFAGLLAVLWRPLGAMTAMVVVAAVVAASSGQHLIVWHNAMGVTWLAGVLWLTAREPAAGGRRAWGRVAAVGALLWLGGMTKVTYQVAALAFAGLFAVRAGWTGRWTWRQAGAVVLGYGLCGVVAPVVTELAYTGATFAQWRENVLFLAQSRMGLLRPLATLGFYWRTPHNYYPPGPFLFVGAWGVGVVLMCGALAWPAVRRGARGEWPLLLAGGGGALVCGAVLLATNLDITFMAGAAWLVLGTGLVLAWQGDGAGAVRRGGRVALALAATSLLVPAWAAAWAGTRALWGAGPLVRSELRATDDLPDRWAYFRGMHVPPQLHDSMTSFEETFARLTREGVAARGFYFVNATEWLGRVVPEAVHRGLPLWLHEGTTLGPAQAREINHRLAVGDEIEVVVSLHAWNVWFFDMEWYLKQRYVEERHGPLLHYYRRQPEVGQDWTRSLKFVRATGSNLYIKDVGTTGAVPEICAHPAGSFLGAERSWQLKVRAPLRSLTGEAIVRRISAAGTRAVPVAVRVRDAAGRVRRELALTLAPGELERTLSVDAAPDGQPVELDLELPEGAGVEAGWRRLRTDGTAETAVAAPSPVDPALGALPVRENWPDHLFAAGQPRPEEMAGAGLMIAPDAPNGQPELFMHIPGEVWWRVDGTAKRLTGEFGLRPPAWTQSDALPGAEARVLFYSGGRLELLEERRLNPRQEPRDREMQRFAVNLPARAGWVGLTFTSTDPRTNSFGHTWWRNVRAE